MLWTIIRKARNNCQDMLTKNISFKKGKAASSPLFKLVVGGEQAAIHKLKF